jgi:hypothetical protein
MSETTKPQVGSEGWARIIHLASALGRPIGTLNSWASASTGALPKIEYNGEAMACVATAKYLHATRNANREPAVIKKNRKEYKSVSSLASEVACEHGLALVEARKRMKREETDFPESFTVNTLTYTDAAAFRLWAKRHGYEPVTLETLAVFWPALTEPEAAPELTLDSPAVEPETPELSDAELVRGLVNDLLEVAHQLETRFVSLGAAR